MVPVRCLHTWSLGADTCRHLCTAATPLVLVRDIRQRPRLFRCVIARLAALLVRGHLSLHYDLRGEGWCLGSRTQKGLK